MKKQIYELNAAGRPVRYLLRCPGSEKCFTEPLRPCSGDQYDLSLTDEIMDWGRPQFPAGVTDAWLEYKLLLGPTANWLLHTGACIIHAVAFSWCGRAWLLCAPSGTGKTTQFVRWKQLAGVEVRLISGDQPIVSLEPDAVRVWASPWTGKERWIDEPGPVPLGGIIFLERSTQNELTAMDPAEAVHRLIEAFTGRPETEDDIRNFAALADAMLRNPVWLLRNRGDRASAALVMEAIRAHLTKERNDA